ncbi:hypothetical protein AJ80_00983 [Polytolypa hystricis UAMH7299]|uniref:Uncharacterized protein n=1 Tax=Polytolypa hystricis (strain UAMH7299) TaxID=1447883 RepID=A0A2B7Z210_POLH7|nr:hypothetical protein AJ80_00983 [Polytolypa hystricis UAMH7299]
MSHTASKTWVSKETKEYEAWTKVRDSVVHISPLSPYIPKSFGEWIALKIAQKEAICSRIARRIATRNETRDHAAVIAVSPALGVKELSDNLSLVLARETIWVPVERYPADRLLAAWPTIDELKHEGDDRSKSGYSRFPPLPRDPGNETVNWKQRSPLAQRPFDDVGRPIIADGGVPPNYPEQEMLRLVGDGLLADLNN